MSSRHHDPRDRIRTRTGAFACMLAAAMVALVMGLAIRWFEGPLRERIAAQTFLEDLSFDLQYLDYVVLDLKAQLVEDGREAEILGIGDSSCQFGLAPAAMGATSGLGVLNLGTFGTVGVQGHIAMLEAALERGANPRCVILWLHPHTLVRDDREIAEGKHLEWFRDRLDESSGQARGFLRGLNDTVGGGLRLAVMDHGGWRETPLGESLTPVEVRSRMLRDAGWFAAVPQSSPRAYVQRELDEDALAHLDEFARRCADKDLPLFLTVMPRITDGLIEQEHYEELVHSIRNAVPGSIWLESMPREVEWSAMQSPTHFARDRAELVSAAIGAEIRTRLNASD